MVRGSLAVRSLIALLLLALFLVLVVAAVAGLVVAGSALGVMGLDVGGRGGAYVIALALACFAGAGVIAWSALPRVDRFVPPGPEVTAAEQPELFAMIREVATATGQPVPAHVYLLTDVNAFVAQRGGVVGIGSRRVMGVGLPLARALTVSELRAVIAHEMGHFHGGDTRLGPFIYKTHASIARTIDNLSRVDEAATDLGSIALVFRALRAPFVWFAHGYLRVTFAIKRAQEYTADAVAARTEGVDAAVRALEKTHGAALAYDQYVQVEVAPLVERGALPPVGEGFARFLDHAEIRPQIVAAIAEELRAGTSKPFDSHPALRDRVAALEASRGGAPGRAPDTRPAITLFRGADAAEQAIIDARVDRPLRPIAWDEAAAEWVGVWRVAARDLARDLGGITPGALPSLDLRRLAYKLLPETTARVVIDDGKLAAWAAATFGPVLATLLVEHGYAPHVAIGEPFRLRRGDDEVSLADVGRVCAGELDAATWAASWEQRGLADVDLGKVGRAARPAAA